MTLQPGQVVDRYTVDRLLGQGGMAVVYRVRHNQLGSFHALKVLTIANAGIRERLLQEGRVQAALRHPNVVTVTDVIDVGGAPGLVMEYVDGPSLDGWLQTHRPSLDEALALFRGIVAGVAAAHEQGLVHRDLKPANVMLAPASGGRYVPKVADFGLAKALAADDEALHRTRSGVTMGTPAYMAPEQIRDAKSVDHRADVFSLGCILYELACGRPPFSGPDVLSIFNAVASGSYPPPASVAPGLPRPVQDAIDAALRTDRDARIDSCEGLLGVLDGRAEAPTLPPADAKRTFDPDGLVPPPLDASLTPPEPTPPTRRFRVRWGRRKATGSLPPSRLRRWFVPLVIAPMLVLGVISVVGVTVWKGIAARWDAAARSSLAEATGGEIAFGDSWVRPWGVTLDDVVVLGSDGAPLAQAARVRVRGRWSPGSGFVPRDVRVDGAELFPRRTDEGWVLPDRTIAALRAEAGEGRSLAIRRLSAGPTRIVGESPGGRLTGFVERAVLREVVLLPAEGRAWTAQELEVGHVTLDAPGPLLSIDGARLEAGTLVVDGAKLWLANRDDGRLDLPPLFAESFPDWLGGTDRSASDEAWFGLRTGLWPVDATRVEVRSGRLSFVDRAHPDTPVKWDLALERLAAGPVTEGWLPIDASATLDEARLTFEGDLRADGMLRGRVGARHLALSRYAPYLGAALRKHRVEPASGRLGGDVDFTIKGDSIAVRLDATAEDVAFGPIPDAPPPSTAAAALAVPRALVDASDTTAGSLADPSYSPIDDVVDAVNAALLAPVGGADPVRRRVVAAPLPSPTTSPGPTSPRPPGEEAPTPAPPRPDAGETLRKIDRFGREVVEVLEEYGRTGRGERRGD